MCGDFHICATKMVVVSISVYYPLNFVFLPQPSHDKSAVLDANFFTFLLLFKLLHCCQTGEKKILYYHFIIHQATIIRFLKSVF